MSGAPVSQSPIKTVLKLLVLSLIVGIVLSWLDLTPWSLVENFGENVQRIFGWARNFVGWAAGYVLIGAVIVVPLWLVLFLVERTKRKP